MCVWENWGQISVICGNLGWIFLVFFLDPFRIAEQRSRHTVLHCDSFCPGLCSRAGAGESCGISARQRHSQEQCGGSGSWDGLGSLLFDEFWSYSGHRRLEQGCICIASPWDVTNDSTGALPLLMGLSHGYLIPWGASSGRDGPVEGLEHLDLCLEGLRQNRARRCMPMAPCEGRVGISGGGIIREQLLLPGSVCLKPRCGRAFTAQRSKGRLLWEQIAPAKAISRDVRPGLPIAHPWNCSWARLCGVLGSSPNRQSGAGKLLLSREPCPCCGKQLSLVLLFNLLRSGAAAR